MESFSIVIPTYNRPHYLQRILCYYSSFATTCPIFIADASSPENRKRNAGIIASFPTLSITHLQHYPSDIHQYTKLADAVSHVHTPFVVACADDDFVVPEAVRTCVEFLKENPDYVCCHGHCIYFQVKKGSFVWNPLPLDTSLSNEAPAAKDRLLFHFSHFLYTLYGVHKTEVLHHVLTESVKATDDYRFGETYTSLLTALHGKIKILDVVYGAREFDPSSGGNASTNTFRYFMEQGTYGQKYACFKKSLAAHLQKNSELNIDDAMHVIDEGMASFLQKRFSLTNRSLYMIKKIVDRMPLSASVDASFRALYRDIFVYRRFSGYKRSFVLHQTKNGKSLEDITIIQKHVVSDYQQIVKKEF